VTSGRPGGQNATARKRVRLPGLQFSKNNTDSFQHSIKKWDSQGFFNRNIASISGTTGAQAVKAEQGGQNRGSEWTL
jgi:hypothetical protein